MDICYGDEQQLLQKMITLTTRKDIVETKKIIRSELCKIQNAVYDNKELQFFKDDNEKREYLELFDCRHYQETHYSTYKKVIKLGHSDTRNFSAKLTEKLIELFHYIGSTEFIIISHLKLDFFGNQENKFKPLKNAYTKLEKIVGHKTYKEAFIIDIRSLQDFVEILFWITRCDPNVPEFIFIFDSKEQIQLNLCQYGNLHLTEFHNEHLSEIKLESLGWSVIDGEEFDNFQEFI